LKRTGYHLLDQRRNEDILKEIKVDPVKRKLIQYKQKWLNHFCRIEDNRYAKISSLSIKQKMRTQTTVTGWIQL
jgi:hypothetical protein